MNAFFTLIADLIPDVAVKGLLLLMATSCIVLFSYRASASARHLIWLLGFAGLLLLPVLLAVLPEWRLRVLAPDAALVTPTPAAASIAPAPSPPETIPTPLPARVAPPSPEVHVPMTQSPSPQMQVPLHIPSAAIANTPWHIYVAIAWLIGFALCLGLWLWSRLNLSILKQSASPAEGDAWNNLLLRAQSQAGVNRGVTLRISAYASMPMTWGTRRPVIVLPVNALEWDDDRKLAVLLHELAHIRRYDCLTQTIAYFACAVHWFNPFVWYAARQMRIEREHACDDAVLRTGRRASDYASHLLGVARSMRDLRLSSIGAVAMARQSQLSGRVQAILDENIRRRAVTRKLAIIGTVIAASALLPLAAAQLAARDHDRPTAVEFNPVLPWTSTGWAGNIDTDSAVYEDKGNSAHFTVHEQDKRHVWVWNFEQPIDFNDYPILVVKYRARHIHPQGGYVLWINDGTGPNNGGFVPIGSQHFTTDGEEHEIRHDVREHQPKGSLTGFALGVHSADALPAEFELVRLAFEADPNNAPSSKAAVAQSDLTVHVQDIKGNPVAGATVTLDGDRLDLRLTATTNTDGNATITPHAASGIEHTLWATKDGMTIDRERKVRSADKPVLTLDQAESLSGVIVNEAGEPVPYATVQCWYDTDETERMRSFAITPSVIADEHGRWKKDGLPINANRVSLKVTHPDYTSDHWAARTPSIAELRDGTARIVLRGGNILAGIVRDRYGNPVAGAHVGQGEDRFPSNAPPATTTQEDGTFRFDHVPDEDVTLTINAPGSGPTQLVVRKADLNTLVEITLPEPHVMRVRVVDSHGNPIPDARITSDTWRGNRSLIWQSGVDADGRTTWNEAPADEVLYDIVARDHMSVRNVPLKVNTADENVVTLPDTLRISGTVTDAETGEPIRLFTVQRGMAQNSRDPSAVSWNIREDTRGYDGMYEVAATFPYIGHVLRIVADGYRPAFSPAFPSDAGTVSYDFKLQKAQLRTGKLLTPDGQSAGGATVIVWESQDTLIVDGYKLRDSRNNAVIVTSETDGSFTYEMPPEKTDPVVVVLHESGYAELPLKSLQEIPSFRLTAWAKITGKALTGAHPDTTSLIGVSMVEINANQNQQRVRWFAATKPDEEGQFRFDRVKPGTVSVYKQTASGTPFSVTSHQSRYELLAGQTLEVSLGGKGRRVTGHITLPDDMPKWIAVQSILQLKRPLPAMPGLPEGWASLTAAQRKEWMNAPENAAKVEAINTMFQDRHTNQRHIAMAITDDGSFQAADVEPGVYTLTVQFNHWDGSRVIDYSRTIGYATLEITVPEIPGGRSDEPLNVGDVPFKWAEPTTQPAS